MNQNKCLDSNEKKFISHGTTNNITVLLNSSNNITFKK
jgi:hypothetical protein